MRSGAAKTVHEIVSAGEKRIPGIVAASAASHGYTLPRLSSGRGYGERERTIDDERRHSSRGRVIVQS